MYMERWDGDWSEICNMCQRDSVDSRKWLREKEKHPRVIEKEISMCLWEWLVQNRSKKLGHHSPRLSCIAICFGSKALIVICSGLHFKTFSFSSAFEEMETFFIAKDRFVDGPVRHRVSSSEAEDWHLLPFWRFQFPTLVLAHLYVQVSMSSSCCLWEWELAELKQKFWFSDHCYSCGL